MSDSSDVQIGETAFVRLTPRERETLRRTAAGDSAKEIGRALGISHRTVHNYQQEAARKLGVTGSVRAARLLLEHEAGTVHIHPATAALAEPRDDPVNPVLPIATPDRMTASPAWEVSAPRRNDRPAGRMIRVTTTQVMLIILAWGVGFGMLIAAVAYLYLILARPL